MSRYIRGSVRAFVVAWAFTAPAFSALAQQAQPSGGAPLQGPRVRDGGVPGDRNTFSSKTGQAGRRQNEWQVPHRVFLRAIDSLRSPDLAPELRLSVEQGEKLNALEREFRTSVQSYFEEHRAEFESLRGHMPPEAKRRFEELRRAYGPAAPDSTPRRGVQEEPRPRRPMPPAPETMNDAPQSREQVREAMRRLYDGAPKIADLHTKVWATLSEAQQAAAKAELEKIRKETAARRTQGAAGGENMKGDDGIPSQLPPRLRERLQQMSPEDREIALERLRQRQSATKKDVPRNPPGMDDVDVPAPEKGDPPARK